MSDFLRDLMYSNIDPTNKLLQHDDDIESVKSSLADMSTNHLKISVKDKGYGAKGDGVTDDSQAIRKAFEKIANVFIENTDVSGYRIANVEIEFPKGVYLINSGDLFSLYNQIYTTTNRTLIHLKIVGNYSTILMKGFTGDVFNIQNNMKHVIFDNIVFKSADETQGNSRTLFNSYSTGNVSDFKFVHCKFLGTFDKVFNLTGNDTNSEFLFDSCGMVGAWDSFLYVGATGTSNQFLNYYFNNCSYNGSGKWVYMCKGGHVKLNNCDVSGILPTQKQYLFNFVDKGNYKSGFSTFIDCGSRYELRNLNACVFYSDINSMQVKFDTCDFSSQVPSLAPNQPSDCFHFYNSGVTYPTNILFLNCRMFGEVVTESDQGRMSSTGVKFDNCSFPYDAPQAFRFITHASYPKYSIPVYVKDCSFVTNTETGKDYRRYPVNMVLPDDTSYKRMNNNAIVKANTGGQTAVTPSWTHDIYKPTLLSRLTFISDYENVSSNKKFHVKTKIFDATSWSTSTVTGTIGTIYLKVNDQVVLDTFDTIYTVTAIDQSTGIVTFDRAITDAVPTSFSVYLILMNVDFVPKTTQYTLSIQPYRMITNGLFLKAISVFSSVAGRIIVETLE